MRIGIDLLWVRVGICGGTESYIRNLLDGFAQFDSENVYILFVAKDNLYSFRHYEVHANIDIHICEVDSANQAKRILWENRYLDKEAKRENIELMFIPVYSKPITYGSKIPYVCVIHDMQALHYPQYFSRIKRLFLRYMWRSSCITANKVIATSRFCGEDLTSRYPVVKDKLQIIYDPVISSESGMDAFVIEQKYHIERNKYFYCVSSMLPHKNLETILTVMAEYEKKEKRNIKLVISGVGGQEEKIQEILLENNIMDLVVLTGFVSNQERDCLYENCRLFLFPSIFEGFGMPPVEAMRKGKNVVMTEKSCLKEVTKGKAIYVKDPLNVVEWMEKIEEAMSKEAGIVPFQEYDLERIVVEYRKVFREFA